MRHLLLISSLLLLVLASVANAEQVPTEKSLLTLLESLDTAQISTDVPANCQTASEQDPFSELSLCPASFCYDAFDCVQACPSGSSPRCISYSCQYGPGSGCPNCQASLCSTAQDCLDYCSEATSATCDDNVCNYSC